MVMTTDCSSRHFSHARNLSGSSITCKHVEETWGGAHDALQHIRANLGQARHQPFRDNTTTEFAFGDLVTCLLE